MIIYILIRTNVRIFNQKSVGQSLQKRQRGGIIGNVNTRRGGKRPKRLRRRLRKISGRGPREVIIGLENYTKAVLRTYPFLQMMQTTYEQHIKNRALLSCDGRMNTEVLAEYLAREILHKRCLAWLEEIIRDALLRLSEVEQVLVRTHFFGENAENAEIGSWSDSKRLRVQARCFQRLEAMLHRSGLTKKYFDEELVHIEIIRKMYRRVEREGGKAEGTLA